MDGMRSEVNSAILVRECVSSLRGIEIVFLGQRVSIRNVTEGIVSGLLAERR